MIEAISVATIAQLIQLSIGPVFLLAGVGAILNVLATRLARIVDRARHLEAKFDGASVLQQQLARSELNRLGKRMKLANWSIALCTASALCVCLVVAILFIGGLEDSSFGQYIAALFVLTMALMVMGLLFFLVEVRIAGWSLKVRHGQLDLDIESPAFKSQIRRLWPRHPRRGCDCDRDGIGPGTTRAQLDDAIRPPLEVRQTSLGTGFTADVYYGVLEGSGPDAHHRMWTGVSCVTR